MKIIPISILLFSALFTLNVFAQSRNLVCPYIATKERQAFIKENYKKIKIDQTEQEVKQILGTPDEVLDLYEPIIKNGKKIGYTFWYILQRLASDGSQNDKAEILVRIAFNLNTKVIAIDHWGFKNRIKSQLSG